jgi:hypothetical protein
VTCPICRKTTDLLSEIATAFRALPPDEQVKFRAEVLRRNLVGLPSNTRPN